MEDEARRIAMLAEMFLTYAQEASPARMSGYLAVLAPVPTPSLREAIHAGMAQAEKGWPPGPGEIVMAWKDARSSRPEERPYREPDHPRLDAMAVLNPSAAMAQIAARVEAVPEREIINLAAELRRSHADHFPRHATEARTPSLVAAAMRLGMTWPMQPDHEAQVTAWMAEERKINDVVKWWWSQKRLECTHWHGTYHGRVLHWEMPADT